MIKSNDTDVVVIALALFNQLELEKLNVVFGKGKHYQVIPVHTICNTLGVDKCSSLLLFHSLTGCDSTTSLLGIGKPTAWKNWLASTETVLSALTALTMNLQENVNDVATAEMFISSMYWTEANTILLWTKLE